MRVLLHIKICTKYLFFIYSDDVSKWVRRQVSGTIDRLETVRVLPWKIGLAISIKANGILQLVLQDIMRTDSLLLFLNGKDSHHRSINK